MPLQDTKTDEATFIDALCSRCKAITGTKGQVVGQIIKNGDFWQFGMTQVATKEATPRPGLEDARLIIDLFSVDRDRVLIQSGEKTGIASRDPDFLDSGPMPFQTVDEVEAWCRRKHRYVIPSSWLLRAGAEAIAGGYPSVTIPRKFTGAR